MLSVRQPEFKTQGCQLGALLKVSLGSWDVLATGVSREKNPGVQVFKWVVSVTFNNYA